MFISYDIKDYSDIKLFAEKKFLISKREEKKIKINKIKKNILI
jgi:hypothetical protein